MKTPHSITRYWDWLIVILVAVPLMPVCSYIMGGATDMYDEGLHFLSGAMFRDGLVPYVDFYPLFPPIWTYAHILIESVFGPFLVVQRLWFVAQGSVVLIACYALLRVITGARIVPLVAIFLIVFLGFDPFWLPRWSGARLAVYILFFLAYTCWWTAAEDERPGRTLWLFCAGLLAGLSNLYALDVGIHLTVAGIFMAAIEVPAALAAGTLRGSIKKLGPCVAGFLAPLVLFGAYLAATGALSGYLVTYYYHYIMLLMPISTEILSGGSMSLVNPRVVLLLLFSAALIACGVYLLAIGLKSRTRRINGVPLLAAALSFIVSISTIRGVEGSQYQMFAFIPMLLWAGFLIDRGLVWLREVPSIRSGNPLKRLGLAVAVVVVPFAVLFPFYAGNAAARLDAARTNYNITRLASRGDARLGAAFSRVPALYGTFDRRFDAIVLYLAERTRPGEAILAFPMYVEMIPALAGRHSATRYPVPILVMGTPGGQEAYIEDIERERPRYMVFYPAARFGDITPVEPYFTPVYRYLLEHYRPVPDFPRGRYQQIWVRVD